MKMLTASAVTPLVFPMRGGGIEVRGNIEIVTVKNSYEQRGLGLVHVARPESFKFLAAPEAIRELAAKLNEAADSLELVENHTKFDPPAEPDDYKPVAAEEPTQESRADDEQKEAA